MNEGDPSLRLAFDVGGSFVKAGLVHIDSGLVLGETLRRTTPAGAAPEAVLELLMGERVEPRRNWLIDSSHRVDQDTIDA